MSQDYQTRQLTTEEGNLSGPIHTGHNQHTHTDNTRQPEINSRVPHVHPPSRAQLEGCHSEPNSRNATCLTPIPSSTQGTLASRPLKYPKSLVDHACRTSNQRLLQQKLPGGGHVPPGAAASRLPGGGRVPPGAKRFRNPNAADTVWRNHPHRQVHEFQVPLMYQLSFGGKFSIARCRKSRQPTESSLSPGGSHITAKRHDSICAILVSAPVQAQLLASYSGHFPKIL